jgi:hypothetical protein
MFLENGVLFAQIIRNLSHDDDEICKSLDKIRDSNNNPGSRLYNWNLISEASRKLGVLIDTETKSLIVAGDPMLINEVLREFYDFDLKNGGV